MKKQFDFLLVIGQAILLAVFAPIVVPKYMNETMYIIVFSLCYIILLFLIKYITKRKNDSKDELT